MNWGKGKTNYFVVIDISGIGHYVSHFDQSCLIEIKRRFSFIDFLNCLTIWYFSNRRYGEIIELLFNECTWR